MSDLGYTWLNLGTAGKWIFELADQVQLPTIKLTCSLDQHDLVFYDWFPHHMYNNSTACTSQHIRNQC